MGSLGADSKTLIVEDNPIFREIIKEILRAHFPSMAIYEASEGNEALEKVDAFHPQLIFMDIRLPGENGLKLTRKIKTGHPDMTVIVLTSYDTLEYRQAALRSGASCFISKDSMNWQQIETCINSLN